GAVGEDPGERGLPFLFGPLLRSDDDRAGAVVDAGGVAGGVGRVGPADRLQPGQRLQRGFGPDRLVGLDRGLALAGLDGDADDLFGETAGFGRLVGEPVGALGEAVHVDAGDLELV